MVKMIEEFNNTIPSRIGKYMGCLLDILQHPELIDVMSSIITI